jgi:hypothetical protein
VQNINDGGPEGCTFFLRKMIFGLSTDGSVSLLFDWKKNMGGACCP